MRVRDLRLVDELVIEGNGERGSECEWNGDPCSGDGNRKSRIATDDCHVDLKTDNEEE